jgi:hypothetical protein
VARDSAVHVSLSRECGDDAISLDPVHGRSRAGMARADEMQGGGDLERICIE